MSQHGINETPISANVLVKQWLDGNETMQNGDLKFQEKWKGQYETCRTVLSGLLTKYTDVSRPTYSDFKTIASNRIESYSEPNPPSGGVWCLVDANVDELEAGVHGMLTMNWSYQLTSIQPLPPTPPDSDTTTWNIDWQSYNFSTYGYCANDPIEDPDDPPETANRKNIEAVFNLQVELANLKNTYRYQDSLGKIRQLNAHEQDIYNLVAQGKNPVFHYPIVTKVKTWHNQSLSAIQQIMGGQDLKLPDEIVDFPEGSPFPSSFLAEFGWLYVGQDVKTEPYRNSKGEIYANMYNVVTTERWMGAESWEVKFYGPRGGNDRMIPGSY